MQMVRLHLKLVEHGQLQQFTETNDRGLVDRAQARINTIGRKTIVVGKRAAGTDLDTIAIRVVGCCCRLAITGFHATATGMRDNPSHGEDASQKAEPIEASPSS